MPSTPTKAVTKRKQPIADVAEPVSEGRGKTRPTRNKRLAAAIAMDDRQQYQLAAAVGINPGGLSMVIGGRQRASDELKARLAAELGVKVEDIF